MKNIIKAEKKYKANKHRESAVNITKSINKLMNYIARSYQKKSQN